MVSEGDLVLDEIIKGVEEASHHAWYKDELIDLLRSYKIDK